MAGERTLAFGPTLGPAPDMAEPTDFLSIFRGRARVDGNLDLKLSSREGASLPAKLRQAYYWIVNNAIIAPYYDIEFGEAGASSFAFPNGDSVKLPSEASFCSITPSGCSSGAMLGVIRRPT